MTENGHRTRRGGGTPSGGWCAVWSGGERHPGDGVQAFMVACAALSPGQDSTRVPILLHPTPALTGIITVFGGQIPSGSDPQIRSYFSLGAASTVGPAPLAFVVFVSFWSSRVASAGTRLIRSPMRVPL